MHVKARDILLIGSGAAIAVAITWALVHPRPGESFPVVFTGRTQAVTNDGEVAFNRHPRFTETFGPGSLPGFKVSGENRTTAVHAEVCLAPGTGEQDVVFAVAKVAGSYSLAWYACLTEGIVFDWAP